MKVVIKQKYFTVGAKFEIKTTEGQTVFFAERQWDRFMGNVVLFDKNGAPVARMQSEFKKVFTSWFSISDSRGNEVCCINEKLPFLCFRRAESSHGNLKVKIKAGPLPYEGLFAQRARQNSCRQSSQKDSCHSGYLHYRY